MDFHTQTGERGEVVSANATYIDEDLDDSETSITLEYDIFDDSDLVTCGEEDITIGTAGTTCTGCTRGVGTTDAATHKDGVPIYKATGFELLSHTFSTGDTLSAIWCYCHIEAMFGIDISGTRKIMLATSPYAPNLFIPMNDYSVGNGVTMKIYAWVFRGANTGALESTAWAAFQT